MMAIDLKNLVKYLDNLSNYELPDYQSIPNGVKMEETISYINSRLSSFYNDNDIKVTNYMINNYVKAKVMSSPSDKLYSKEQLGYMLFIGILKNSASLRNIASLIALDKDFKQDKEDLYLFYKELQESVDQDVSTETYNIAKKVDGETDEKKILLRLAYTALRLYVRSATEKVVADYIMNSINENVLPSKVLKEDKKEKILEKKILDKEAKVLSNR